MKKILLATLLFSICNLKGIAQNYYQDQESVYSSGITYNVELDPFVLILNNASNRLIRGRWTYKNGTVMESDSDVNYLNAEVKIDPETLEKAFKETFTNGEYQKLKKVTDAKFEIHLVIADNLIQELEFLIDIYEDPVFLQIPPAKYALLEKNIKKYVKVSTNECAKKFKYMHLSKFIDFSKMPINYGRQTVSLGK